eukprot:gb/GEZN01006671.1/.p1 GENE.gb/GEZN01006671.1/~~gb/GEZN01006671.1/.p1  ORF type:complete len:430 (-),score=73.89 gb/GEZN01006671.1/:159-1448(-)
MPSPMEKWDELSSSSKWCCISFCLLLLIISCILLGVSFKSVDNNEYCFRYGIYSREVDPDPYTTPGSYFVGLTGSFLCFPGEIQYIDMSGTNFPGTMSCRTFEGLPLTMDVYIEYRLTSDPAELWTMFNEVATDFTFLLILIARSEIRNAVSLYNATDFLDNNRPFINAKMLQTLAGPFDSRHALLIDVQLKDVHLEAEFDKAITAVREVTLRTATEREKLGPVYALERTRYETDLSQARAAQEVAVAVAEGDVLKAINENKTRLIRAKTDAEARLVGLEIGRENQIITAMAQIDRALQERVGALALAQARQQEAMVGFEIERLSALNEELISTIATNATAKQKLVEAQANIDTLALFKQKELQDLQLLQQKMSNAELLRSRYIDALAEQLDAKWFIDYKKISYFLEGGSGAVPCSGGICAVNGTGFQT